MKKIEEMIMRINNGNIRGGQTKLANQITPTESKFKTVKIKNTPFYVGQIISN